MTKPACNSILLRSVEQEDRLLASHLLSAKFSTTADNIKVHIYEATIIAKGIAFSVNVTFTVKWQSQTVCRLLEVSPNEKKVCFTQVSKSSCGGKIVHLFVGTKQIRYLTHGI